MGRKESQEDLTGKRCGMLTVIEKTQEKRKRCTLWRCRCDCGRAESMRRTLAEHGTVAEHVHLIDGTGVEKLKQRKLQKNNTSGYTGVQSCGDKWIAVITFKGKVYYLGSYWKLEDAVRVRRQAEEKLFGEFLKWYYETVKNREKP